MDRLSSKGQMIDQINLGNIDSSSFDRRNHNFLSCKLGKLVPTRVDEVYPGDRIVGHVEAVANFEPLVAPIMGSMVMKQESFYIPTSILWKDAHKFFTGKHDFNGNVPSVSPWRIYKTWFKDESDSPFWDVLSSCYSNLVEGVSDFTGLCSFLGYKYRTFASTYQCEDLLHDIIEELSDITSSGGDRNSILTVFQATEIPTDAQRQQVCKIIIDCLYHLFTTIFGVSTIIDYMGMPAHDNLDELFYATGVNLEGDPIFSFYNLIYLGRDGISLPEWTDKDLCSDISLNWLPMRAAYVCWYWNYRDQLLETSALDPECDSFLASVPTDDEIMLLTLLRVRCWYKDTFTTALTNTGDANLIVPTESNVGNFTVKYYHSSDALINTEDYDSAVSAGATTCEITLEGGTTYRIPINYLSYSHSSGVTESDSSFGVSLDLFDRIRRLRNFIQKRLILGYEYDDMVWSSFRVKLSNVRMRIPELLARGRDEVTINTIVNNTNTSEQDAGDKTAIAYCHGRSSDINYFAEEHGYFISFVSILPIQSYSGGMQRLWMRQEQFDFMWPEFATMGMDAIYNYELSAPRGKWVKSGLTDAVALQVFGYQGRYYDLKSRLDEEHGRLRTDLNYMTFSRDFNMTNRPKLNYQFVHCWPSLDMFVTDDPYTDVVKCMDVFHAIDFQRRLPVPSEFI